MQRTIDSGLTALPTVENKRTGTIHIAHGEFGQPVCGAQPHDMRWEVSPMMGEFPDDFGDCSNDCAACASVDASEYVVEDTEYEY